MNYLNIIFRFPAGYQLSNCCPLFWYILNVDFWIVTATILSEESDQTTYMVYHSTTMTMPMNTPTDGHGKL